MRIDRVHLKNIGPHHELEVEFGSGLIGLLGPNGAGKSTLVNSIYAALTNDYSRFNAVKADIVTNNTGKKQSYIRIAGSHHGQTFHLTRWLRPNKAELSIGDATYTKANDINAAIEDQLGISKLVIDKYVFVNQWEMFQFLSQTDSERAKTFQYLCGTEAASRIHKICNDYVARQKGTEVVDNSIELEEAIDSITVHMDHHADKGRAAKKHILSDDKVTHLKRKLKAATDADEAEEALGHAKQLLGENRQNLTIIQTRLGKLRKRIARNKKSKEELGGEALEKANDIVENWNEYRTLGQQKEQLEEALSLCKEKLDANESFKPVKDVSKYVKPADREEMLRQKGELEFQQRQDSKLLDDVSLDDGEESEQLCPHCQQVVTLDHITKVQADYNARDAQLKDLKGDLDYSRKFDQDMETYESNLRSYSDALIQMEDDLSQIKAKLNRCPGAGAYKKAKEHLQSYNNRSGDIVKDQELVQRLEQKCSKMEGRIESLETEVARYQEKLDNRPAEEGVTKAYDMLEVHEEAVVQYKVALECFRDAKENRSKLRKTLDQLKLRLKEKAKIRGLLDTIGEVGELFHWNNLPKTVSQANLELLVDDINDNLMMFNNPFSVEADEDLTFKVYFPGKSPVKAKQLSGGQKVILAIAFRAALDRVFGHDVGMMFLDEPTAGLDADNVEYFHDALQQLAQKVHGNRQLVVITHVQELGEAFDQLIEIQKD